MDAVENIIRKLVAKEADLIEITFKTSGTVWFDFHWHNRNNHPKYTDWELTGVSKLEISSQVNRRYLQVLRYRLTKEDDTYHLELELESDTRIAVSFQKIKVHIT